MPHSEENIENPDQLSPEQLADELRQSMANHLYQKAEEIREKYGPVDYDVMQKVTDDRKFIRYPVNIVFDSSRIEPGIFAFTDEKLSDPTQQADEDDDYRKPAERSYDIVVHEHFRGAKEKLLPLILYHLPVVNYGEIVTYEDCEIFGAAMMDMTQDAYYQLVCDLVDSIP